MAERRGATSSAALSLHNVTVERDGRAILDAINWEVFPGERWVLLGPNGSGKTTLLRVASMYMHPTSGTVDVLGARLGRVDVRTHRERIGVASAALADLLRPTITALEVVMTARHAALEAWWHSYSDDDRTRAHELLERMGCGPLASRTFGTLSSGERQRVQLARVLMTEPGLLLLDEPMAGLDLGGREDLILRLEGLAADPATPPMILVTHHVDEIPRGFDLAVLLRAGQFVARGPIEEVLRSDHVAACFGLPLSVTNHDGRWSARSTTTARPPT